MFGVARDIYGGDDNVDIHYGFRSRCISLSLFPEMVKVAAPSNPITIAAIVVVVVVDISSLHFFYREFYDILSFHSMVV